MPRREPAFIWRKAVSPDWLAANEAILQEWTGGAHAVVERPGRARSIIEMFCATRGDAEELRRIFGGTLVQLRSDWERRALAASKTKPLRIGRKLIIVSDRADARRERDAERVLVIPAGAAFGTGEHPTTAMSLRLLERVSRRFDDGWRMLDAGTGSGILALAGRCFGACAVIAIDNDQRAISTATANARSNRIACVTFLAGDALQKPRRRFDVITANLYSELLARALPVWAESLRPRGRMILSGVMRSQEQSVVKAIRANGFRVLETRRRGKWIALLCSHKNEVDGTKRSGNFAPP